MLWKETPGIMQNENKVIGFFSSNCEFVYDNGKYGLGEMSFGIKVKNKTEGQNLIDIFNTKLYKFVSQFVPYSGTHGGRPATVKYFPKLDLSRSWTNKDLYDHFKLTPDERTYIDKSPIK